MAEEATPKIPASEDLQFPEPINDNIILELETVPGEEKSAGGIIVPVRGNKKRFPTVGKIVRVGPGRPTDLGPFNPMTVKVGDRVLFDHQPHLCYPLTWEGKSYLVTRELYVHAVLPLEGDVTVGPDEAPGA